MGKIKVAVTINENYIYPLKVMLHSLFTSQKEAVMVFCVHARISQSNIMNLKNFCMTYGAEFVEIKMTSSLFENAPVMGYFSIEMYYRLLLPWILPQEDRVLYLDPDMIRRKYRICCEGKKKIAVSGSGHAEYSLGSADQTGRRRLQFESQPSLFERVFENAMGREAFLEDHSLYGKR